MGNIIVILIIALIVLFIGLVALNFAALFLAFVRTKDFENADLSMKPVLFAFSDIAFLIFLSPVAIPLTQFNPLMHIFPDNNVVKFISLALGLHLLAAVFRAAFLWNLRNDNGELLCKSNFRRYIIAVAVTSLPPVCGTIGFMAWLSHMLSY